MVSFPDSKRDIAMASDHLCPSLAADELNKLGCTDIPVHVFHMKPWFADEIIAELDLPGKQTIYLKSGYRIKFT